MGISLAIENPDSRAGLYPVSYVIRRGQERMKRSGPGRR